MLIRAPSRKGMKHKGEYHVFPSKDNITKELTALPVC